VNAKAIRILVLVSCALLLVPQFGKDEELLV